MEQWLSRPCAKWWWARTDNLSLTCQQTLVGLALENDECLWQHHIARFVNALPVLIYFDLKAGNEFQERNSHNYIGRHVHCRAILAGYLDDYVPGDATENILCTGLCTYALCNTRATYNTIDRTPLV